MSKSMYILGALLIAGFAVLGVMEMMKSQTPYVTTAAKVRSMGGRPVQFIGAIMPDKIKYNEKDDELLFDLRDEKSDTLKIRYKGVRPANFETADKAVVRGTYRGDELVADQVLLKCPSKYKGEQQY